MAASADLATVMKMTGMRSVDPADHPVDFQARLVGQPQVEEDHIRSLGPEAVQPRRAARRDLDPVERCGECLPDLLRDQGGIVIDEK